MKINGNTFEKFKTFFVLTFRVFKALKFYNLFKEEF